MRVTKGETDRKLNNQPKVESFLNLNPRKKRKQTMKRASHRFFWIFLFLLMLRIVSFRSSPGLFMFHISCHTLKEVLVNQSTVELCKNQTPD